jgi:formylmethanofuran dehydrogenase subunit A
MSGLTRLRGGIIYDPQHQINGEVRDIYFRNGIIVPPPGHPTPIDQDIDISGKVVMAGAIDIHSHIAGGNVNTARLITPDLRQEQLHHTHMRHEQIYLAQTPRPGKWSTRDTGRRYAQMGYTTVVEPAILPSNALQAHLEMADIPIIDTAGLAVLGSDDFLLRLLREKRGQQAVEDYVAWTLQATRCLGLKVINAGGALTFKFNARTLQLDEEVPFYGVSSRTILNALQRAVCKLGVPHPLHVHCNNLGIPGNVATTLATIEAAQGLPMHLTHIQFHSYSDEGKQGFCSGAARIAEAINANPNITADVGQVLFGQTVTISGDVMRQFNARSVANPGKWVIADVECEGGGGILPYHYKAVSFVNTLQWAIGLELFLLVDDPWRIFFTTDSPNGAPFTRYPELVRLLMDRDYRNATLASLNPEAAAMSLLKDITREYSLYELAITTRAAPARLLGLTDRGHLGVGALADIAVYEPNADYAAMFAHAAYVFKNGQLVVQNGEVLTEPLGRLLTLVPTNNHAIECELQSYYDNYFTLRLDHLKIRPSMLGNILHPRMETRF